jgi:hypothetical protein
LPNFFSKGSKFGQKWPYLLVLNTGKYRQISAGIGIGIWSPEYRYSGIGIYRKTLLATPSQLCASTKFLKVSSMAVTS